MEGLDDMCGGIVLFEGSGVSEIDMCIVQIITYIVGLINEPLNQMNRFFVSNSKTEQNDKMYDLSITLTFSWAHHIAHHVKPQLEQGYITNKRYIYYMCIL